MFLKFIRIFFIIFSFDFCICAPTVGKNERMSSTEESAALPPSLVEMLRKNQEELQELKALLKSTKTPQHSNVECPALKIASTFRKLVQHIKQQIEEKKCVTKLGVSTMRPPKIVRVMRRVDAVMEGIERVISAGQIIKSDALDLIKVFVKEAIDKTIT